MLNVGKEDAQRYKYGAGCRCRNLLIDNFKHKFQVHSSKATDPISQSKLVNL
jgi:hypothetical protein